MGASKADLQDYIAYRRYLTRLGGDNAASHSRLMRNLRRALMEELTPRQREMVLRYFVDNETMTEIAWEEGVNVSTVSRTIKRGKERLRKCLRYGARELLNDDLEG